MARPTRTRALILRWLSSMSAGMNWSPPANGLCPGCSLNRAASPRSVRREQFDGSVFCPDGTWSPDGRSARLDPFRRPEGEDMYTVDIDTGGTMTDGLVADGSELHAIKVDTTPHDFTVSFRQVLVEAARPLAGGGDAGGRAQRDRPARHPVRRRRPRRRQAAVRGGRPAHLREPRRRL